MKTRQCMMLHLARASLLRVRHCTHLLARTSLRDRQHMNVRNEVKTPQSSYLEVAPVPTVVLARLHVSSYPAAEGLQGSSCRAQNQYCGCRSSTRRSRSTCCNNATPNAPRSSKPSRRHRSARHKRGRVPSSCLVGVPLARILSTVQTCLLSTGALLAPRRTLTHKTTPIDPHATPHEAIQDLP